MSGLALQAWTCSLFSPDSCSPASFSTGAARPLLLQLLYSTDLPDLPLYFLLLLAVVCVAPRVPFLAADRNFDWGRVP